MNGFRDTVDSFKNERLLNFLINYGIDVNYKFDDGYTMLHLTAAYGSADNTNILLLNNANANPISNDAKTPLDIVYDAKDKCWDKENNKKTEILFRKHGGKTMKELKAEGK